MLDPREQLDQPSLAFDSTCSQQAPPRSRTGDSGVTNLASATVVAAAVADAVSSADPARQSAGHVPALSADGAPTRALSISFMAGRDLQDRWLSLFEYAGYSDKVAARIIEQIPPQYIAAGKRLFEFLAEKEALALPIAPQLVIEFYDNEATSARPINALTAAKNAILVLHELFGLQSPVFLAPVRLSFKALLRTRTTQPIKHKKVFDMQVLLQRILHENLLPDAMNYTQLRSRALLLCALSIFARPADLTAIPLSEIDVSGPEGVSAVCCNTKTDGNRNGFVVLFPYQERRAISTGHFVLALRSRLLDKHPDAKFLFMSENGRVAIGADRVRNNLRDELHHFGAAACSGASIRTSAATWAVRSNLDPYFAATAGHWASSDTMRIFYDQSKIAALRYHALWSSVPISSNPPLDVVRDPEEEVLDAELD